MMICANILIDPWLSQTSCVLITHFEHTLWALRMQLFYILIDILRDHSDILPIVFTFSFVRFDKNTTFSDFNSHLSEVYL